MPGATDDSSPRRRPPYFWWLLINGIALCFAVISWMSCLHVFGKPEIPRNYRILDRIGRLPEIKDYQFADLPNGERLDPPGLYRRFGPITGKAQEELNQHLLRSYLTGFSQSFALSYLVGNYQLVDWRPLGSEDFITDGAVVRAWAMVKPDDFTQAAPYPVVVDLILPGVDVDSIPSKSNGAIFSFSMPPAAVTVIRVGTIKDTQGESLINLTAVPISYSQPIDLDSEKLTIRPPKRVNPAGRFLMFRQIAESPAN
ncbi:MAG: hypothetical protein ACO3RV_06960 [Luteolibacter sp.]